MELLCIWILTRPRPEQKGKGRRPGCCHCKHLQARASPAAAGPCLVLTLFWWQRVQDVGPVPEAACWQRALVPIVLAGDRARCTPSSQTYQRAALQREKLLLLQLQFGQRGKVTCPHRQQKSRDISVRLKGRVLSRTAAAEGVKAVQLL